MTTTLVTDDFAPGPSAETAMVHNYQPHSIVYGQWDWTDGLDDLAIALLVDAGVIVLDHTIQGVGFETRIYRSLPGNAPVRK